MDILSCPTINIADRIKSSQLAKLKNGIPLMLLDEIYKVEAAGLKKNRIILEKLQVL